MHKPVDLIISTVSRPSYATMSLLNFGFVAKSKLIRRLAGRASGEREDSDLSDHDVISGADNGQVAEEEEKTLSESLS